MARRKINLEELPSNNQTTPNRNMVLRGEVRTTPRGGVANKIRDIGNSLYESIIRPAMEDNAIDFFNEGIRMLIKGQSYDVRPTGRQSYNSMYRQRQKSPTRRSQLRRPKEHEETFEDVYFNDRRDAEGVLGRMMERIAHYDMVTIGDLYSLVGITSNFTHERWGWRNLRHCKVIYTTEGYVIDFPDPDYIK
ncbi:MAG: hypothetical protein KAV87_26955 [Desulfobacteraceae bacterium]|nr:hypothetical protein [Desulfobacteraceae bacterium]